MSDKVIENNQVSVIGEIVSGFTFSHEVFGEGFYMVDVLVRRLSDSADVIPVMISERLINVEEDYTGEFIRVAGQFRSYNRHEEKKNRLVLSVFAREVEFLEEEVENAKTNQIFLDGYICKAPVYRKTPLGREIADLLIDVYKRQAAERLKKVPFEIAFCSPLIRAKRTAEIIIGDRKITLTTCLLYTSRCV